MGLSADKLTNNAFRILGLPATATQSAIEQAARRMRVFPDPSRLPPTPWDHPWLGALSRKKIDLEHAVARLTDPKQRVRERLLWFHEPLPVPSDARPQAVDEILTQDVTADAPPAARHDVALARYASALLLDPLISDAARWQRAIDDFRAIAQSPPVMQYLLDLENAGDFEKRARGEEIADALNELPRMITDGLVSAADAALDSEDLTQMLAVMRLLRSAGDKPAAARLLDHLEDMLERRCHYIEDDLRRGIRFDPGFVTPNKEVATQATAAFDSTVLPGVRELDGLGEQEAHRAQRVKWACAKTLSMLGTAWVYSHQFVAAEETLQQAIEFARGTAMEAKIREQINENALRARQQRQSRRIIAGAGGAAGAGQPSIYQVSTNDPGMTGAGGRRIIPPAQPQPLNFARRGATTSKAKPISSNRWFFIVLVVFISALLRGLASSDHSSSDSRSPADWEDMQRQTRLMEQAEKVRAQGWQQQRQKQQAPIVPPKPAPVGGITSPRDAWAPGTSLAPPTLDAPSLSKPAVAASPPPASPPSKPLPATDNLFAPPPAAPASGEASLTQRILGVPASTGKEGK